MCVCRKKSPKGELWPVSDGPAKRAAVCMVVCSKQLYIFSTIFIFKYV